MLSLIFSILVMGSTAGRGWTIGQDWDGDSESDYYNGAIDEVKIFNKVLSSDEVNALHNDSANSM